MVSFIIIAIFAQITLTFVLLLRMGMARRHALIAREVRYSDIALNDTCWPEKARKLSNCYKNQFELPVIFYGLCLVAMQIEHTGSLMAGLAWGFVISRVVHAYIHTTSNVVLHRGVAFIVGFFILAVMMILLLIRILFAAG